MSSSLLTQDDLWLEEYTVNYFLAWKGNERQVCSCELSHIQHTVASSLKKVFWQCSHKGLVMEQDQNLLFFSTFFLCICSHSFKPFSLSGRAEHCDPGVLALTGFELSSPVQTPQTAWMEAEVAQPPSGHFLDFRPHWFWNPSLILIAVWHDLQQTLQLFYDCRVQKVWRMREYDLTLYKDILPRPLFHPSPTVMYLVSQSRTLPSKDWWTRSVCH